MADTTLVLILGGVGIVSSVRAELVLSAALVLVITSYSLYLAFS